MLRARCRVETRPQFPSSFTPPPPARAGRHALALDKATAAAWSTGAGGVPCPFVTPSRLCINLLLWFLRRPPPQPWTLQRTLMPRHVRTPEPTPITMVPARITPVSLSIFLHNQLSAARKSDKSSFGNTTRKGVRSFQKQATSASS